MKGISLMSPIQLPRCRLLLFLNCSHSVRMCAGVSSFLFFFVY